ncbi:MFS transporter [Rhodopseudomonas sp.]|uniref:MFS transporter n=1 Tax=Rhodopseudomonas sp. TaxID=1078 RepID=UPI0025D0A76D|nr:MFS transporter [Rhodopseudomonas sp.]
MSRSYAPTALMLGNFVTGTSVLAPAGMLGELSADLGVTIRDAGLLITFGAVVLCIGSPLTAWLTSRIERRTLLGATLAVLALSNLASALAPSYAALLIIRLIMLSIGSLYTPQAAGTAALVVPPDKRGGTMAYVFLGWSLAVAFGLPLVTFIASRYGWRAAFGGVALIGAASFVLLAWRLPGGLTGAPVNLKTWTAVARNRLILMLLLVTAVQTSGQFAVFTYFGPLLARLTAASADAIGLVFAIYGVCGFVGNMVASRIVDIWGAYRTSLLFIAVLLTGASVWTLGAGSFAVMAFGVGIWGLGFASTNSMQQVRLVGADPTLASATVSLNTSVLYIGQAVGSAIGGALFASGWLRETGYVSMAFIALALGIAVFATRGGTR